MNDWSHFEHLKNFLGAVDLKVANEFKEFHCTHCQSTCKNLKEELVNKSIDIDHRDHTLTQVVLIVFD